MYKAQNILISLPFFFAKLSKKAAIQRNSVLISHWLWWSISHNKTQQAERTVAWKSIALLLSYCKSYRNDICRFDECIWYGVNQGDCKNAHENQKQTCRRRVSFLLTQCRFCGYGQYESRGIALMLFLCRNRFLRGLLANMAE